MIRRYIIKKLIVASSVEDAIKKDKKAAIDEVYVDPVWLDEQTKHEIKGFTK